MSGTSLLYRCHARMFVSGIQDGGGSGAPVFAMHGLMIPLTGNNRYLDYV